MQYEIAFARLAFYYPTIARELLSAYGSAQGVWEERADLACGPVACPPALLAALADWNAALAAAEREMEFAQRQGIAILTPASKQWPARLDDCDDAPTVLYCRGAADLNARRVINIVGTRKATDYGRDTIRHFIEALSAICPGVLVVSGLAYGVDIAAHRAAMEFRLPTVGVVATGLDTVYPPMHQPDAAKMTAGAGGIVSEMMSGSRMSALNFRRRNRIIAGMADATILAESAATGGGLITTSMAADYGRPVFAFPGNIGAPYSVGCNELIASGRATLLTGAKQFAQAMHWQGDIDLHKAMDEGIPLNLFPKLGPDEQAVAAALRSQGDLSVAALAAATGLPATKLHAILFKMEMAGTLRTRPGGIYHLA